MWMTAGNIVCLTDLENSIDGFGDDRMLIVPRMAEVLAQIAFADQDDADPGHLFQYLRQILDRTSFLALDDHEDLTARGQGPHVGPRIVLLLGKAPVPCGARRRVAADAGRVIQGGILRPRIATRRDRVAGLLDR